MKLPLYILSFGLTLTLFCLFAQAGETRPNLRFENNKLRLYWIDENGLIAEPTFYDFRYTTELDVPVDPATESDT